MLDHWKRKFPHFVRISAWDWTLASCFIPISQVSWCIHLELKTSTNSLWLLDGWETLFVAPTGSPLNRKYMGNLNPPNAPFIAPSVHHWIAEFQLVASQRFPSDSKLRRVHGSGTKAMKCSSSSPSLGDVCRLGDSVDSIGILMDVISLSWQI